jgi:hypothetical protein
LRGLASASTLVALIGPAVAQAPPWETLVRELAPALRACLSDRPGAMAVEAWPMNHGKVGARILLPDGAREDCVADLGRAAVDSRRAVEAGDRRPGEGLRAFMLDRRCVDAWRVTGEHGRELGWLAYPGCG